MKLIDYRHSLDCDVEFQDEHKQVFKHVVYANFLKGQIKNSYGKTVCGVGMIGNGKYKSRVSSTEMSKDYDTWTDLLARCYKYKEKSPSYYDIATVCDEWLNFQNFAAWYEKNVYTIPNNERLQVDKDVLNSGNKVYSPNNCIMVPQRINLLFTNATKNDGLPNGIRRTANGKKFMAMYNTEHLGCFETLNEAYEIYTKKKENAIKQIADEYKDYIPEKLYNALYEYQVKIEDDKNYIDEERLKQ